MPPDVMIFLGVWIIAHFVWLLLAMIAFWYVDGYRICWRHGRLERYEVGLETPIEGIESGLYTAYLCGCENG